MVDDYVSATKRHRADAASLAGMKRFDNAGHLIGIAAECAIKVKLREIMGSPDENFDGHHPRLQSLLRQKVQFRGINGQWLSLANGKTLFPGWNISDRYASDNHVSEQQYGVWETMADKIISLAKIR